MKPLTLRAIAGAALAVAGLAQAQDAALDQVTVVGSRAKARTVFDSAVPVDLFNAREVGNALSSGEVGAALQNLAPSINFPRIESSGASDSVRGIQLRGLGPDQVLVLVNGKRRHASALLDTESSFAGTVPVDINAIPAGAIERIEILRDGAGAQYGSDAVAGVINIVLKQGRSGGTAAIGHGANHTRFQPTGQTLTDGQTTTANADAGIALGDTGFLRFGFDARRRQPTERAGKSDAGWTSWNGTPADLALDGKVLFKSGDSRQDSGSLFYNAQLPVTLFGAAVDAYSFATLNRRLSDGSAWFRYPGDPSNVAALYPAGYRPVTHGNKTDASLVAGVKFALDAWQLDASARHGADRFNYGVSNTVNASLGAQSPTSFHLASFRTGQQGLNLDATREWTAGWGAPVNLALGAELLHETYRTLAGDPASYAGGAFTDAPPGAQAGPGLRPSDVFDGSRNVKSVYADAETEFGALLLGAAARWSDYSDFGSATTGKLSARYKIAPGLLVRGAVSNSFRAPALAQTGFRFATLNFNADGTGLQTAALLPASDALARAFGAQPLKPEKSDNVSLGVAWRIAKTTSVSLDAYRIRLRDRITRTSDLQSDAVSAYLAAQGRADTGSVAFLANLLDTTTRGVDAVLNHELKAGGGTLNLSAALNVNKTLLDQARTGSAALAQIDPALSLLTDAGLFRLKHASPRNKLVLGADWQAGAVGVQARATRFGALQDFVYDSEAPVVDGVNAQYFGPVWTVDLEAQYKVTRHWTATAGANNLFDRYPDRVRQTNAATYGGALPYNFINPVGANGAYFYGKLTYTF